MTRVIVFGSRTWENVVIMQCTLCKLTALDDLLIVHGDCPRGADHLAQLWAEANGIPTERHPANWNQYGRGAGHRRNEEMASLGAFMAIGFRDVGSSPGTDNMIQRCKDHHIAGHVVRLEQWA